MKGKKIGMITVFINTISTPTTIIKLLKNKKIKKEKYKNKYIKTKNSKHKKNKNIINIENKYKIISNSIGKGFCGVIKKHKFSSNRASHGNSKAHNKPGSIGMCQTPGKIFKGKKMAGRVGNKKNTQIIEIILYKHPIIYIKGNIAGYKGCKIKIKKNE